jgi:hypothetical protein
LKVEDKKETEKQNKKNSSERKTAEIADQISQYVKNFTPLFIVYKGSKRRE